jgi:hypothetical protein
VQRVFFGFLNFSDSACAQVVEQRSADGDCIFMSRRPARFTTADVARAIKAAKREGAPAVEIKPDGTILVSLSPTRPDDADSGGETGKAELVL